MQTPTIAEAMQLISDDLRAGRFPSATLLSVLNSEVARLVHAKLKDRHADLWWALREIYGYTDLDIWCCLHQTDPKSVRMQSRPFKYETTTESPEIVSLAWAMTMELLCGDCQCRERYRDWPDKQFKGITDTCEKRHTLAVYDQNSGTNPDQWLGYAVHGNCNLRFGSRSRQGAQGPRTPQMGHFKAFGKSLLGHHLRTPSGSHLLLVPNPGEDQTDFEGGKYLLIDTRSREFQANQHNASQYGESAKFDPPARCNAGLLVWCCRTCKIVLGQSGAINCTDQCVWEIANIVVSSDTKKKIKELPSITTKVYSCQEEHFWPDFQENCPDRTCERKANQSQPRLVTITPISGLKFEDL